MVNFMKKYYLETLSVGCPKNILESAQYRSTLESNGYNVVDDPQGADVIIYNTCGCLETLQQKAKEAINSGVSLNKDKQKKVIAAGCYPLIDKENNLKENNVLFFPPGDVKELKNLLSLESTTSSSNTHDLNKTDINSQPNFVTKPSKALGLIEVLEKITNLAFPKLKNFSKSVMMTANFHYVQTGSGCLGNCTFCGIKLAIGNPKSVDMNTIINGVRKGILNGKKDIWLVSDDLGAWGADLNQDSSSLLLEILNIPSHMNLVVNYFEPEHFVRQISVMKKVLKDKRVVQICIPMQTGSQSLLRRMGRHYNIKEVCHYIESVRKANPDLVIKTQLITGFPGETWDDFFQTLRLMSYFDGIGVNAYARLKFTPAHKLKPLPDHIVKLRTRMAKFVANIYHFKFFIKNLFNISLRNESA